MGKRLIVTTSWDDGTKTDTVLAGLLDKHGMKGTFYTANNFPFNPLDRTDIQELSKRHEIGAHTMNHVTLTKLSLPEAKQEIGGSKSRLEDIIGKKVGMFCYPCGRSNSAVRRLVKNAGFVAARTCTPGDSSDLSSPYEWQITACTSNYSPLSSIGVWLRNRISIWSILDWEKRARMLFDLALAKGGVYHIWGHSSEINGRGEWGRLDDVFSYIGRRDRVEYLTNGEVFKHCPSG